MQKIIVAIMALAFGLTVSQGAFARMKDKENFGYCPDGTKVPDTTKCPKKAEKIERDFKCKFLGRSTFYLVANTLRRRCAHAVRRVAFRSRAPPFADIGCSRS